MIRTLLALALAGAALGGALLTPQGRALLPAAQAQAPPGGTAPRPVQASELAEIAGHLAAVQGRLALAEARADSLARLVHHRQAEADSARLDASALARTLVRMDDEALAAVARQLSGRAFGQLYGAATARSQTRLLSALAPSQAALFVRHHLPGADAPAHAADASTRPAASPDSLTAHP